MTSTTIHCKDHAEVAAHLEYVRAHARDMIAEAAARVMEQIGLESQDECPRKGGNLIASLSPPNVQITVNGVRVSLRYHAESGQGFDYAAYQHEVPHQNYTTAGTKWKYLEDPFYRHIDEIPQLIIAELEKMMNEG